ncbi:MAG: hypothetical protein RR140_03815 [Clostridia bacterium]
MKRAKMLATIIALALGTTAMVYGVMSAKVLQSNVNASLSFDLAGLQVDVTAVITGAKKSSANDNFTPADGETVGGTVDANGVITKQIYAYSQTGAPAPDLGTWAITPSLFFHNKVQTPIEIKVIVKNYTLNKRIEVSMMEIDTSGNELVTSSLSTIAERSYSTGIADMPTSVGVLSATGTAEAKTTYALKTINMATQSSALPFKLKVKIAEFAIKNAPNSVVQEMPVITTTQYTLDSQKTISSSQYLLSWFTDVQCTKQIGYNYTPSENQTLYAKTSKYPLFIPTIFELTNDPAVGGIGYSINGIKLTITKINSASQDFSLPPKITIAGTTYDLDAIGAGAKTVINLELPYGVTQILANAFYNVVAETPINIKSIVLPATISSIGDSAFCYCPVKIKLYAMVPPTLGTNAFQKTGPLFPIIYNPVGGYKIQVNQTVVDTYKSVTNWAIYKDCIFYLENDSNTTIM